jgi:hypothetical protein
MGTASSRFMCLTRIAGQIIYYLTRGLPGGQITWYWYKEYRVQNLTYIGRDPRKL